jgi:signal transduction histidine kinase
VLLFLVLLTWLLLRGLDTKSPGYLIALQAFDDFALAEASLHRDVLQARAGLLHNYDPLSRSLEQMERAAAALQFHAEAEGIDPAPAGRLAALVTRQAELTEQFKSDNAILQNSLAYAALLSTSPAFGAKAVELAPYIGTLAAAILQLTRDTSPESIRALERQIGEFAEHVPAADGDREAAQAFLTHARLLHDLLPAADERLRALLAVPSRQPLEETRVLFAEHQSGIEATARRFRWFLYAASLLLLVMLARLGMNLRARAHALRRRAAFERAIAETSTRLISFPPSEIERRLEHVLGGLAKATGMERGYVVLNTVPMKVHAWCADGATYPLGWPEQAAAVSAMLRKPGHDIIALSDVATLPAGECRDALTAAGVGAWGCMPLIRAGKEIGILGFDAFRSIPKRDQVYPISVMRLVADAVAGAIERESLARDRARLTARLERARRMQTIGSLTSGIAHNFNNIIGAILGYAEMAEPRLAAGSKPAQHLREIRQAAERGRDLIEHILTFGRRSDAPVQRVQLHSLLGEAASLLTASLPKRTELIVHEVPPDLAIAGEPVQLQQIILNLCTNAAQAMEGSGAVHIAAEQKDLAIPLRLSHGELAPGQYVSLAVSDTGRGFDEAVARRLFEPFFTTRLMGTGLGLATVREIVHGHNGAMNVASEPGRGSRFEAWLPLAPAENMPVPQPAVPAGNGQTIMIVESKRDRLLREEEMIAALGYEPVGFERPGDAIAACRASPSRFDVFVISHGLGMHDGLDLARALHKIAPARPLLLAVASSIEIAVDRLADAGISEILQRPLVSGELAGALRRCLRPPTALQT